MNLRIAINLRSGCNKNFGIDTFGQSQSVHCTDRVGFDGFDRIVHVVGRTGRAGQVVNFVYFYVKWVDNVVIK